MIDNNSIIIMRTTDGNDNDNDNNDNNNYDNTDDINTDAKNDDNDNTAPVFHNTNNNENQQENKQIIHNLRCPPFDAQYYQPRQTPHL